MSIRTWFVGILVFAICHGAWAAEPERVVKIGGLCDKTASTQRIGLEMCPGTADYIALVNKKGGVLGHKLQYTEIEHAYVVPRAVDAYERLKQDGVVTVVTYGVPILLGLTSRYMEDKIPAFNTGTGRGDAIDGEVWPYIFPGTASYWSQTGAAMKYIKDNGAKKGTKIALLYLDSPAGRDAIPMVEAVAKREGYVVRKFAVQPPGLDLEPQVSEITRDFKADWVFPSLFGEPPPCPSRSSRRQAIP